jgi:hypothetical protein
MPVAGLALTCGCLPPLIATPLLAADGSAQRYFSGHTSYVTAIAFDGAGALMATAQEGKQATIRLWDYATCTCLAVLNGERAADVKGCRKAAHMASTPCMRRACAWSLYVAALRLSVVCKRTVVAGGGCGWWLWLWVQLMLHARSTPAAAKVSTTCIRPTPSTQLVHAAPMLPEQLGRLAVANCH